MLKRGWLYSVRTFLIFISIFLVGVWLRFDRLGDRSFWFDEIVELGHARGFLISKDLISGSGEGGRLITRGYYVFLAFLELFTKDINELVARLPAFFFGILTIPLIYKTGKGLFGIKEGIIGSFLLSVSTYHIAYSQEARPYSMLAFFSLLTFYFLYQLLKRGKILFWIGFCFSSLLNIYTHYAAFYVLGAEIVYAFVWVILNFHNLKNKKYFVHYIFILLICISILLVFLKPVIVRGVRFVFKEEYLTKQIEGLSFSKDFFYRIFGDFACLSIPFVHRKFMLVTFTIFFFYGIVRSMKKYRLGILGLVILVVIPFGMLFTFFKPYNFFNPRYFIFILPIGLIGVAHGINTISRDIDRFFKFNSDIILSILVFFVGLMHIYPLITHHYSQKDDWRGIARLLNESAKDGDIILISCEADIAPLSFYLTGGKQLHMRTHFKGITAYDSIIWYVVYFKDPFVEQEGYKEFREKFCILDIEQFSNCITLYKLKDINMVKTGDIGPIRFEAENAPSFIGKKVRDKDAENGFVKRAAIRWDGGNANLLMYGPWLDLPKGDYIVKFRMKVENNKINEPVVRIDVNNPKMKVPIIVERNINGEEFNRVGEYQDFYLAFSYGGEGELEFRVHYLGKADVWVDYVEVVG